MNDYSSPEKIYNGVLKGAISRSLAQNQLLSLIEGNDVPEIRSNAIDVVKNLKIRETDVFKSIENIMLSDENAFVRNSAAEVISTLFLTEGLNSLKWVIEHEVSPLVLCTILKTINQESEGNRSQLLDLINERLSEIGNEIGIVPLEAAFILDIESLFSLHDPSYELSLDCYKFFKLLRNSKDHDPWLKIQDKHIISLTLTLFNWRYIKMNLDRIESILKIEYLYLFLDTLRAYECNDHFGNILPNSIRNLKYLQYLDLSDNYLGKIPKELENLKNLEKLIVKNNNISLIPNSILTLPSLKELDISKNKLLSSKSYRKSPHGSLVIHF